MMKPWYLCSHIYNNVLLTFLFFLKSTSTSSGEAHRESRVNKFLLQAWFSTPDSRLDAQILLDDLGICFKNIEYALNDEQLCEEGLTCLYIMLTLQEGSKFRAKELFAKLMGTMDKHMPEESVKSKRKRQDDYYNKLLLAKDPLQSINCIRKLEILTASRETREKFKAIESRFKLKEIDFIIEASNDNIGQKKQKIEHKCQDESSKKSLAHRIGESITTISEEALAHRISEKVVALLRNSPFNACCGAAEKSEDLTDFDKLRKENTELKNELDKTNTINKVLKSESDRVKSENQELLKFKSNFDDLSLNYSRVMAERVERDKEIEILKEETAKLRSELHVMTHHKKKSIK